MKEDERSKQLNDCSSDNHKESSKIIVTVGWAVCAGVSSMNILPTHKYLLISALILFSISLLTEFFAGLSFIKCCDLAEENNPDTYFYRKLGIIFQRIRNVSFIIGFLIFFVILTLKIYGK